MPNSDPLNASLANPPLPKAMSGGADLRTYTRGLLSGQTDGALVEDGRAVCRLNQTGWRLLPLGFESEALALARLDDLAGQLAAGAQFNDLAREALDRFIQAEPAQYTLCLLAEGADGLAAELARAREGLPKALQSGADWQTPAGSYFTPNPAGAGGRVAFVYPGAFGTYVGMGSELFYLFPQLYQSLLEISDDPWTALNVDVIFPEDISEESTQRQQALLDQSPTLMISSGTCFSYLFTVILRDIFKVNPGAALGYSLGEISMMFAAGIWGQADGMRTSLEVSPLFQARVSGRQLAVREFWQLNESAEDAPLWANFVVMAPYEKVRLAAEKFPRVYITHINAPRQVVIGGDPAACRQLAADLNCMHLQAPYAHAIHCEPVRSEMDAFRHLHHWPVEGEPNFPVYSAAEYAPLTLEAGAIAESFARMLTHTIDFPRLVDRAYTDGARAFIELGAGSNCSKWISAILKDRPHAALTINQAGMSDHAAIFRLLARLASHGIPADLSVLAESK
jgi:PfaB family protein